MGFSLITSDLHQNEENNEKARHWMLSVSDDRHCTDVKAMSPVYTSWEFGSLDVICFANITLGIWQRVKLRFFFSALSPEDDLAI